MQQEKAMITKSIYDAGWSEKVYLDTKRAGKHFMYTPHRTQIDEEYHE